MKRILIPTDFSENAQKAIDYALTLFDNQDTCFTLLNTFYIPYSVPDVSFSANDISYENSKVLFEKERKRIGKDFPLLKAKIETKFSIGDVVGVVAAEEENFDLVVMGTKGASGLTEVFIGSRTASMVKTVSIPVLVVPMEASIKRPKQILFATDDTFINREVDIELLKNIAIKNSSKVDAIYVSENDEEEEAIKVIIGSEVDFQLIDIPHEMKHLEGENVEQVIADYTTNNSIDLIAMITNKGNLFYNLFHQSVTKKVVLHTKIPLLVMQTQVK